MTKIGRYELLEQLGEGAYAVVWLAQDTELNRKVALKVLKPALIADGTALGRFRREAQVLASLVHPQIAFLWDMGQEGEKFYLAVRYIEGPSLEGRLKDGPLTWAQARRVTEQIAAALGFAHSQNILHRDVKPANIILGKAEGAVLTDFGLAQAGQTGSLTKSGTLIGTPQYIAPEVWHGQPASPASDQYALACILAEMLSGKALFEAPSLPAIMGRHFQPLALPTNWPDGAPRNLEAALRKALEQDPAKRFPGVAGFVEALRQTAPLAPRPAQGTAAPAQARQGNEMSITLAPGVEMVFVCVPAGEFLMGSDKKQDPQAGDDEIPQRKVMLDEYWIGKYPVTMAQFAVFAKATEYKTTAERKGEPNTWRTASQKPDHPVVYVSWEDAVTFCTWARLTTGQNLRLPTEAEWEKAARGTDGRLYPWGSEPPNPMYANYNSITGGTTPPGKYSPQGNSPYGCVDMAGNVWEWVNDWYNAGYYKTSPAKNPPGPASGKNRVLRGGSWGINSLSLRVANRDGNDPDLSISAIGFRCVAPAGK